MRILCLDEPYHSKPDRRLAKVSGSSSFRLAVVTSVLSLCLSASGRAVTESRNSRIELANSLVDSGSWDQASQLYGEALVEAQAAKDDLRASLVFQNIGRMFDRRGDLLEAERAYLRSIALLNSAPARNDQLLIRAHVGLSVIYIQAGQYAKAEVLARRALTAYPKGSPSDRASLTGTLGVARAHRGRFRAAEQTLRDTVRMCHEGDDATLAEIGAVAIANLGKLQMARGDAGEASTSFQNALSVMESLPSPYPATLALTMGHYAEALHETGEKHAADRIYQRAIELATNTLGQNHGVSAHLFQKYADLLRDLGRTSDAGRFASAARRVQSEWRTKNISGQTVDIESLPHK